MYKFIILFLSFSVLANTQEFDSQDFKSFIGELKQKAIQKNISTETANILDEAKFNKRVLELDNRQAEFSLNFNNYIKAVVNTARFLEGRDYFISGDKIFDKVYQEYGVPKHILIAFWGIESNYSRTTGAFNLIDALTTLSYDKRRREFFSSQLIDALILIDKKYINKDVKGSWAGAMGGMQFMPYNLLNYGVDANSDGKIDLWHNTDDIFMSAGNFLQNIGWRRGEIWGREIILPEDFDYKFTGLKIKKSVNQWADIGVKKINGEELPNSTIDASIIVPMGHKGPKFLVYNNFEVILRWNRSVLYALAVGVMANKFIGIDIESNIPFEENLNKQDIKFIQKRLTKLGFDAGPFDGILGSQTKSAVMAYQISNNLIADGFVGKDLLQRMQKAEAK